MATKKEEYIRIDFSKGSVRGCVFVFRFFQEGEFHIYAPSLNLMAYGKTQDQANEMLKFSLNEFSDSMLEENNLITIREYLDSMGWRQSPFFKKKFNNTINPDESQVRGHLELDPSIPLDREIMSVA